MKHKPGHSYTDKVLQQRDRYFAYIKWLLAILFVLICVLLLMATRHSAAQPDNPADPVMAAKIAQAADYIASVNPKVDAEAVATELVHASYDANLSAGYWLLVALARYESTYRPGAIGKAGERGLLQLHPVHFDNVRMAGLDPERHSDCTLYAALMLSTSLAKGKSLWAALRPWTVRKKALRLFYDLRKQNNVGEL